MTIRIQGCSETTVRGERVIMHPLRCLFISSSRTLVISDLHVGKAGHFRKNGIALPVRVNDNNSWNLVEVIEAFQPDHVLFLGDLMHSESNREWDDFLDVLAQFEGLRFTLVRGNHEVYDDVFYQRAGFVVVSHWKEGPFLFRHEPAETPDPEGLYALSGHVHPAVRFSGKGKQSLTLPCFLLGADQAILPAFGTFTGHHVIRPGRSDQIFVVAGNKVVDALSISSPG